MRYALDQCPFCRGKARLEGEKPYCYGQCLECGAEGPHRASKRAAVDAWNARPVEAELKLSLLAAIGKAMSQPKE